MATWVVARESVACRGEASPPRSPSISSIRLHSKTIESFPSPVLWHSVCKSSLLRSAPAVGASHCPKRALPFVRLPEHDRSCVDTTMSYHQRPAPPIRENGFSTSSRRADSLNNHLSPKKGILPSKRGRSCAFPDSGVPATPGSRAGVTSVLRRYLCERLQIGCLDNEAAPTEITDGWDSYTYRFRLAPSTRLPPNYEGLLAVSIYSGPQAIRRVRHEFAVQCHV